MADIRFDYPKMASAVSAIQDLANQYASAADTLNSDFKTAVRDWEGDTQVAMMKFMDGAVLEYTKETVPKVLNALAELLQSNMDQMKTADQKIGESIPQSLTT